MSEPDFLSQTADAKTDEERKAWYAARTQEANAQGAAWHRYSFNNAGWLLHEAWKERPADEGPTRWQISA